MEGFWGQGETRGLGMCTAGQRAVSPATRGTSATLTTAAAKEAAHRGSEGVWGRWEQRGVRGERGNGCVADWVSSQGIQRDAMSVRALTL